MIKKNLLGVILVFLFIVLFVFIENKIKKKPDVALEQFLGQQIFFDTNLSEPTGMSCATCHDPKKHFAGNNGGKFGVAIGSRKNISGMRNTPSVMYASFSPPFQFQKNEEGELEAVGGMFWDGRVNTLAAQAKGPLFNKREMNNTDTLSLTQKLSVSEYAGLFRQIAGQNIFDDPDKTVDIAVAALESYESTPIFHPFSSKYDAYIQGKGKLTAQEKRGLELFKNPQKGNCVSCHMMNDKSSRGEDNLFTDFTYDGLGLPRNMNITDNKDPNFFDLGLCGPERTAPHKDERLCGQFRVPSLRNVATREFYFHNGYFKNLRDAVAFYATRDTNPNRWFTKKQKFNDTPLKYQSNINTDEVPYNRKKGEKPALNEREIDDITAFLKTLTDK